MNPKTPVTRLARQGGKLIVLAHTQVQLDMFMRNNGLRREDVRRISIEEHILGTSTDKPLILLPAYQQVKDCWEILAYWDRCGGQTVRVSEEQVLGKQPLCGNDTNSDGDCHLCAQQGGCPWPHRPNFSIGNLDTLAALSKPAPGSRGRKGKT